MQIRRYIRLRARYWSIALVLTCGLTLGYFVFRTYIDPLPRQYQLDFGEAQWIEPAEFSPIGYFRKSIFLSVAPEQAWIQVAATDGYQLIVNGHRLGNERSLKARVAGIYDVKAAMTSGTNVIAVEINRDSYPGSAQLLLRGLVKQAGLEAVPILSDRQWRVTARTGIVAGSEVWNSPLVQDETWPNAKLATILEDPVHIEWVPTNPLLLQLPPAGKWLLAQDAPPEAIFLASLNAKSSHQETWIQVAASGDLDLLINGQLVTTVPTAPLKEKNLPTLPRATLLPPKSSEQPPSSELSTASAASSETLSMQAYDISHWIKSGSNSVIAAVRSDYHPATFLAQGFTVRKNGTIEPFQTTSSQWQTLRLASAREAVKPRPAIEFGSNGSAPWGYLRQGQVKDPRLADFNTVAKACATLLACAIATLAVWLFTSVLVAHWRGEPIEAAMSRDGLFHAPFTLILFFLIFLSYDWRFSAAWPFQSGILVAIIVALGAVRLLHQFGGPRENQSWMRRMAFVKKLHWAEALPYLILAMIVGLGLALRYHKLGFMSFDHDEMGLVQKSKGVLKYGYPCNEYTTGVVRAATTYELVPYCLALSGWLFGYSEWSMRLPSCVWGALTIAVLGLMGRRLFNWRTGLLTAFIYACLTLDIRWAQNAFYLQQCQFMAMLTFWFFYEAFRTRQLQRRYLTAASVAFCLTFLSWEGSGFVLPAFLLVLLVMHPGKWWWLKEWHLYRCLFCIAALVIAQFCWRTLAGSPYLMIGSGLTNVSGPSLFFQTFGYQGTYYLEKLFLAENHLPFTVMLVVGIPFCWRQRGFRYVVTLLLSLAFLYTNFLAALSPRYCYFYQPLLILGAVAAAVAVRDQLVALARRAGNSTVAQTFAHAGALGLFFLLFAQSNEWLLQDYHLSGEGDSPGLMTRMNTYRYDYRGAAHYVKSHFQRGDVIIPVVPHVFENYTGMQGNFFLDTLLGKKISYTALLAEPVFTDKFRGYPAIRSLTELLEATHRGRRTWIVFVPYGSLEKLSSPEVLEYLDKSAKIVFESYHAKVFLIEGANHPGTVAQSSRGL